MCVPQKLRYTYLYPFLIFYFFSASDAMASSRAFMALYDVYPLHGKTSKKASISARRCYWFVVLFPPSAVAAWALPIELKHALACFEVVVQVPFRVLFPVPFPRRGTGNRIRNGIRYYVAAWVWAKPNPIKPCILNHTKPRGYEISQPNTKR
jgi:hypothetical protein